MSKNFSLYIRDESLSQSEKVKKRQELLNKFSGKNSDELFSTTFPIDRTASTNCENLVGSVEIPVGIAGPVNIDNLITATVNRKFFKRNSNIVNKKAKKNKIKDLLIPLATTEGALIASISRGCKALTQSGNLSVITKKIGMTRALVFECESTADAYLFTDWINDHRYELVKICESTSNHLKFISYQSFIRGRNIYLRFSFDTDEAMGMNMVSIALKHTWDIFKKKHPKVKLISLSGNVCMDKKDSALNRIFGRGFSVELESTLKKKDVVKMFGVTPDQIVRAHVAKNLVGSNIAGSLSQNMHVANALAAFYIATGQDPAHAVGGSEASVTFEVVKGNLYVALNLPTISVGSVGGGTWFPKQTQARELISSKNKVDAFLLASVAGVAALAGELSGLAALTNQSLAMAHNKLGRAKKHETEK